MVTSTIVESLVGTTVGFASLTALFIIRKIMLSNYCNKCKMNSSCQSDLGIISIKIERITPTERPHENATDLSPTKMALAESFAKSYTDRDRSLFNQELANRLNTVIPRAMKIQSIDGIDDVSEEYVDENGSFSRRLGSVLNRSPTRHYQRESSEQFQRSMSQDLENRRSYDLENRVREHLERVNSIDNGERQYNSRNDENQTTSGSIRSNPKNLSVRTSRPEYNEQKGNLSRRPSRSPTEHR